MFSYSWRELRKSSYMLYSLAEEVGLLKYSSFCTSDTEPIGIDEEMSMQLLVIL